MSFVVYEDGTNILQSGSKLLVFFNIFKGKFVGKLGAWAPMDWRGHLLRGIVHGYS